MFDKLIESEPEGADCKNRRTYFMVSSLVVGTLFLTAVVISIFAADFGLGSTSFELTQMLSPIEMAAVEPEPLRQQQPATQSRSTSQTPTRQIIMSRTDEPTIVPTTTSTTQNLQPARPNGIVDLGPLNTDPGDSGTSGRNASEPNTSDQGLTVAQQAVEDVKELEPPPVKKDPPPIKRIVSDGVVNGKATYLPIPAYPATAKAIGAFGKVDVQIMIDESGKVVSVNAVSGHPLLKGAAERAAWNARFSTTYLSKVPVKVTGVIVYNFTR